MNIINLVGNVANIKATEQTKSGKAMLKFSVATRYKKNGEDSPIWHNIVVFDKLAEICAKYLISGAKVALSGMQMNESYKKDDNTWVNYSSVFANTVEFVSSAEKKKEATSSFGTAAMDLEDIPF